MSDRKPRVEILKDFINELFKENQTPYKLSEVIDVKGKKYAIFMQDGVFLFWRSGLFNLTHSKTLTGSTDFVILRAVLILK